MHPFEKQLLHLWSPADWRETTVLVGVSGGGDSVALLRALAKLRDLHVGRGRLIAAHFNHQTRGADSQADCEFVIELCRQLHLPHRIGLPSLPSAHASEASLRDQRYRFFRDQAAQDGARWVVLAHTLEDQAETILHRILRGSGLTGLAGMSRARALIEGVALLRPLLTVAREDLRQYLRDLKQPYCEDASNQDPRYTRNRIRGELLPHLAEHYNPQVSTALVRLGQLARQSQATISPLAEQLLEDSLLAETERQVRLDRRVLRKATPYLTQECLTILWKRRAWPLQAMTMLHWEQLAAIAQAEESLSMVFPGEVRARGEADWLRLDAAKPQP